MTLISHGLKRRTFLHGVLAAGAAQMAWPATAAGPATVLPGAPISQVIPGVGVGFGGDSRAKLATALQALGGITQFVRPGMSVLVKPNIGYARHPSLGATSSPVLLYALLTLLRLQAPREIVVTDNPVGDPQLTFATTELGAAAQAGGAKVLLPHPRGFGESGAIADGCSLHVEALAEADVVINLACVKDHPLTGIAAATANLLGLLGGDRLRLHADIHDVLPQLATRLRPTLNIIDGQRVLVANGPLGGCTSLIEDGGCVAVSTDPLLLDRWAYRNLLRRHGNWPSFLEGAPGSSDTPG